MTYEYKCQHCGAQFDRQQRITDEADPKCLRCGHLEAVRLVSGTGSFVLKGSGWASDGYA